MGGIIILLVILLIAWIALSAVLKIAFGLIIPALVAMFIGYLAGKVLRGKGYGPIMDLLLGLGGGVVGSILFGVIGVSTGGLIGGIFAGVVGAVLLVYGVRVFGNENFGK